MPLKRFSQGSSSERDAYGSPIVTAPAPHDRRPGDILPCGPAFGWTQSCPSALVSGKCAKQNAYSKQDLTDAVYNESTPSTDTPASSSGTGNNI